VDSAPLAWVTGAKGLIGNELVRSAQAHLPGLTVRGLSRETVDFLDGDAVTSLFRREHPALVVHCAAVNKHPVCQADPEFAHRSNVGVTRRLAELASDVPFVFFSSDLVFDGTKGSYVEEDAPKPLSVYGETKARAEDVVRPHPQHLILRISLTGGHSPGGTRAFNEEMKNAWREGRSINLFTDEYRCVSVADILARAIWELVAKDARGTFHLCFPERLSRYEIGMALAAKHPELNPRITAGSRRDYKGAPRPEDTSMLNTKAQALLSFQLPRFTGWIQEDRSGF
jgi:dTDP-4-dehydrorhamnose reductase